MAAPKTQSNNFISATAVAIFTAASGKRYRIKEMEFHNIHTSSIELRLWLAPNNSGSVRTVADDDRYQALKIQVPSGETVYISVGWTLDSANDVVLAKAGTADKISSRIHYIEEDL